MYGQTCLKYTRLLYLRTFLNLITISLFETAGLGKILHLLAAFMGMLQVLPLILENSSFPYFLAILFKKIIFSN